MVGCHPQNPNPLGRLASFLLKNSSHPTWPSNQQHPATFKGFPTKNYKYWWYFCFFNKDLLEIHQIWWDPTIFRRDLVQIRWIQRNFGTDSETRKPTDASPKTNGHELDDLTINTGWFRFLFSPTRTIQVELGLGTNPNRTTWPLIRVEFCFDFHPPEQFRLGLSQAQTRPGLTCGHP